MFDWPKQPQEYPTQFEDAYQAYLHLLRQTNRIPASREVVLHEANKGFDSVPRVIHSLIVSAHYE